MQSGSAGIPTRRDSEAMREYWDAEPCGTPTASAESRPRRSSSRSKSTIRARAIDSLVRGVRAVERSRMTLRCYRDDSECQTYFAPFPSSLAQRSRACRCARRRRGGARLARAERRREGTPAPAVLEYELERTLADLLGLSVKSPSTSVELGAAEKLRSHLALLRQYLSRGDIDFSWVFDEFAEFQAIFDGTGRRFRSTVEIGFGARPYRMLAYTASWRERPWRGRGDAPSCSVWPCADAACKWC